MNGGQEMVAPRVREAPTRGEDRPGNARCPLGLPLTTDNGLSTNLFLPAAMAMVLSLLIGFVPINSDPDLWFHLADGDYILSHGQVPDADPFSFTRPEGLWVPHSWLFDVLAALSWRHLGPRATEALMAVPFMLTVMIGFGLLVSRGVYPLTATGICLGLAVGMGNTRGIRPQVFSLLLAAVVILLLVRHRHRPRARLLLIAPAVFLVWAQLHSACIMGLVIMVVWLAGRGIEALLDRSPASHRRELILLAGVTGLSALATLITPHRVTHFKYVAMTMGLRELRRATEWQVPRALSLDVPDVYAFLLLAVVIMVLARRSRRVGWAEIGLCTSLIVLSMSAIRHIPLACVGSIPLLADALARGDECAEVRGRESWKAVVALAVAAMVVLLGFWRFPSDIRDRYLSHEPVRGTRALSRLGRELRVFTTYNTGSFVLFADPGRLKVFVDSRADVYGDEILAKAYWAMHGHGWDALCAKYEFDAAVVQRGDPLAGVLAKQGGWALLAEDPAALTFLRESQDEAGSTRSGGSGGRAQPG